MISYLKNKVNIFLNKLSAKIKYIQILLDGAYRPTDFKCAEMLFLRKGKDRATAISLLGLVICYEIAQKGAKIPLKMQK